MYNTYITYARKYKLFAIRFLHSIKHTLQISGGKVSLDGMPPSALLEGGARDEVVGGMESELVPTEPSQTYPTTAYSTYKRR